MNPSDSERLAAVERQLAAALAREDELRELLADLSRAQRADRARLTFLRELLAGEAEPDRPALEVLEGAAVVDAASVQATAAADQSPGWAAHSDRVAGRSRRVPHRDRHGLRSL